MITVNDDDPANNKTVKINKALLKIMQHTFLVPYCSVHNPSAVLHSQFSWVSIRTWQVVCSLGGKLFQWKQKNYK
jgi:hypothetical protein